MGLNRGAPPNLAQVLAPLVGSACLLARAGLAYGVACVVRWAMGLPPWPPAGW